MITSNQNPKIKWVRQLQNQARARKEETVFVVEGVRLAEEALNAGWKAELVLHSVNLSARGQAVVSGFAERGGPVEEVMEGVLEAASDTQTPQGILVVVHQSTYPLPQNLNFALIADEIRDPGNLGAILRSAAAAGVQAVFLNPGCADPFSPKVVRSAMGAHFRLHLAALDWPAIQNQVTAARLHVALAAAGTGMVYTACDFHRPSAIIIGGEATGAGAQAHNLAETLVHIPMAGSTESLNAAAAAAILLFEVVRQRGQPVETSPTT
ncbi:MAG TPA: RNA methyltransferase [Anaerolineales bacterium]|nr:RNA methyltransferase [Anaerolineales bacterium]